MTIPGVTGRKHLRRICCVALISALVATSFRKRTCPPSRARAQVPFLNGQILRVFSKELARLARETSLLVNPTRCSPRAGMIQES